MNIQKKAVDLTDLAIGIIVLAVVVSIGSTLLVGMRDARRTDLATVQTGNETIVPTTDGTALSNQWVKSVDYVLNVSGDMTISTVNYTTSVDAYGVGRVANVTQWIGQHNNGWNVTYTWYNTSSRYDYTLSQNASVGLGEYGNWFKIIVIVGVAAVVLSLIFMAFGKGGSSMSGESGVGGSY